MDGKWLSVLEYATYKKKSISTIRRYIKAKRVKFKEENGKYYIWVKGYLAEQTVDERKGLEIRLELERLKKENMVLKEKLAESKMLIHLYENGKSLNSSTPSLPELPL